jgi:hypothetical protein
METRHKREVLELLRRSDALIAEGEKRIGRQIQFIEALKRLGYDLVLAQEVLLTFRDSQALLIARRNHLRHELSEM